MSDDPRQRLIRLQVEVAQDLRELSSVVASQPRGELMVAGYDLVNRQLSYEPAYGLPGDEKWTVSHLFSRSFVTLRFGRTSERLLRLTTFDSIEQRMAATGKLDGPAHVEAPLELKIRVAHCLRAARSAVAADEYELTDAVDRLVGLREGFEIASGLERQIARSASDEGTSQI